MVLQSALPDFFMAHSGLGALEGYGSWLANTDGRSIVESCLIDM